MSISADTVTLQPAAAPIAPQPLRQPSVAPVGEREGASNDRRKDAKDGRARAGIAFRSFLNAATFAGLSQAVTRDTSKSKSDTAAESITSAARAEKAPARDEPPVIDAAESEQLYRSAQAAKKASQTDTQQEPAQQKPDVHASVYQAVSTRYAKSFFSVAGTFAKRGESLEFTA